VLRFDPGPVVPGDYHFDIGTAGSTTLVLQTLLPALLRAARPSRLVLEGGTHNPLAPSFDFLDRVFLPLLRRMGARVQARLQRLGFYPAGGGRIEVEVTPVAALHPVVLLERGRLRRCDAYAVVSRLPGEIAERELRVLASGLDLPADALHLRHDHSARGPGNAVTVVVESEHLTEAFTAYGQKGIPAEQVAAGLLAELRRYLAAGVPVGEHLADQLLLPLALAGGGAFRTLHLSTHASTNMAVIRAFVPVAFDVECLAADDCRVELRADDAREGLGAAD
jgi:RNA 3'-terminal phosphate cyclase (ATP)